MTTALGWRAMPGSLALGEALRSRMTTKGVNQEQVSRELGKSQSWVSRVLSGAIAISDPDLELWASLLGTTTDDLWDQVGGRPRGRNPFRDALVDLLRVRVLDQEGSASLSRGVLLGYTHVSPEDAMTKRSIVGIRVRGTCLAGLIEDGDLVLVDTERTAVNGSVVVATDDEHLHIKRLAIRRGRYVLTSNEPEELTIDPVQIEGVVFKVQRDVP